jgi:hypothetical protein
MTTVSNVISFVSGDGFCGTREGACSIACLSSSGISTGVFRVVLIEDKASGTQLIQELIAKGCPGVTRYQPTGDKTMRMHAQTAMVSVMLICVTVICDMFTKASTP